MKYAFVASSGQSRKIYRFLKVNTLKTSDAYPVNCSLDSMFYKYNKQVKCVFFTYFTTVKDIFLIVVEKKMISYFNIVFSVATGVFVGEK